MADELVIRFAETPEWQAEFPIIEPVPMAAAPVHRPSI
jgi:hypothetical protein